MTTIYIPFNNGYFLKSHFYWLSLYQHCRTKKKLFFVNSQNKEVYPIFILFTCLWYWLWQDNYWKSPSLKFSHTHFLCVILVRIKGGEGGGRGGYCILRINYIDYFFNTILYISTYVILHTIFITIVYFCSCKLT